MPTTAVTTAELAETSSGPLTLTASAEHIINFDTDLTEVEVLVDSTTSAVTYVSVNRAAATVGGKHCIPVHPGTGVTIPVPTSGNTQVRLITAGTGTAWVNAAWDLRNG